MACCWCLGGLPWVGVQGGQVGLVGRGATGDAGAEGVGLPWGGVPGGHVGLGGRGDTGDAGAEGGRLGGGVFVGFTLWRAGGLASGCGGAAALLGLVGGVGACALWALGVG